MKTIIFISKLGRNLFVFAFLLASFTSSFGQTSIRTGATFNYESPGGWAPANLTSVVVDGEVFDTFAVPSSYSLDQLGPGGHDLNDIIRNAYYVVRGSDDPNWDAEALAAYQSTNLNHYFTSRGNGRNICGDFTAIPTTDSQIQSVTYSPPIPINDNGILAITERNANNCIHISVIGIPAGGGPEVVLGQTFVNPWPSSIYSIQNNIPPQSGADYWLTPAVHESNYNIGVALYRLTEFAPVGAQVTQIRFTAATEDVADGKFLILQSYANEDSFETDYEQALFEDVSTNDNVPAGSSYTALTAPSNGDLLFNADGTFTYTPDPGFSGIDFFQVEVCLPAPNETVCDISTVSIRVRPGITINDAVVTEGDNLIYTITISSPFARDIDLDINYLDNTTSGALDYSGPSQVTLLANETSAQFSVNTIDDALLEPTETLDVIISDPNGFSTLVDDTGLGTILDNDTPQTGDGIYLQGFNVNEGDGTANFTVSYSGPDLGSGFTLDYTILDGPIFTGAESPSDYTVATANGTLNFTGTNGESQNITVTIVDDVVVESTEYLTIELSNLSTNLITIIEDEEIGYINDNDAAGTLSISDFTVNEAVGTANFVVTYTGLTVEDGFRALINVTDGSATDPEDYTSSGNSSLLFAGTNGETQNVILNIENDLIVELTENLFATITGTFQPADLAIDGNILVTTIGIADGDAEGTILDNDGGAGVGIEVLDFSVDEDEGTGIFIVRSNTAVQGGFTVNYTISDITAQLPGDYTVSSSAGTLTFVGLENEEQSIIVNIVDDAIIEDDEDLQVVLSGLSTSLINIIDDTGIGVIIDNDGNTGSEGISVSDFSVNEAIGSVDFIISYTGNTVQDSFTVDFAVNEDSATEPEDYMVVTPGSTLTFPANTATGATQVVTIAIIDDALLEPTELLDIELSNISNASINMVDAIGIGTILDNDGNGPGEGLTVSGFSVNEDAGTADFVITYTGNTLQDSFTVDFDVTEDTATNPDDYAVITTGTTLTFPANTVSGTTQVVTVSIVDDGLLEPSETLDIAISNVSNPLIAIINANATGTINDNDSTPSTGLTVSDFAIAEDGVTANFVITYNGPTVPTAFTVNFVVNEDTALNPADYTVATLGPTVLFPANTNGGDQQAVTININDDFIIEPSERLEMVISNVSNPLIPIVDDTGIGTITDNDSNSNTEGIAVSDFTVNEAIGTVDFIISYTGDNVQESFTVNFSVTEDSATDPEDYTVLTGGPSVTFPAGTVSGATQVVTIVINDDTLLEATENLDIELSDISNPSLNMLDAVGIGTILDNDGNGPTEGLTVSDFTVNEDAGTVDFVITYTGNTVAENFSVDFLVRELTATETLDYSVLTQDTAVVFPQNTVSGFTQVVRLSIADDLILESDETLEIEISNVSNPLVAIIDNNGLGTILDNDSNNATEGLVVSDFTVNEAIGTVDFVISYTGNTVQNSFTVDFMVDDGTATNPADYGVKEISGTLTFPAGTGNGDAELIGVNIVDDLLLEPTENLSLTISNSSTPLVNIVNPLGTGTILDNDGPGVNDGIAVADFNVNEAVGTVDFVISYTGPDVQNAFTVDFVVNDRAAIDPDDYTVLTGGPSVTFPAGTVSGATQLVTISVVDDALLEPSEDLEIRLSNISNPLVPMLDDLGIGTILDNDGNGPAEGIAVADFTINEDAGTADFVISYTGNTVQNPFDISFSITDGSAIDPDDYSVITTGTFVTFPAGTVSGATQLVTISIVDDIIVESLETLDILIALVANPPGLVLLDPNGVGTIIDNDLSPIGVEPYTEEMTIMCGDPLPEVPELIFTGGCGDYTVNFTEETVVLDDTQDYLIVRTWEVTDSCGNTATFEQRIFVMQYPLEEIIINICVEDEPINLVDYLPTGFNTDGDFLVREGNVVLSNSNFDPTNLETGPYIIDYVSETDFCQYNATYSIFVNGDCVSCDGGEISINSTITANGDGKNDFLEISGVEYCAFRFDVMVFNRWGDKVFEKINYQNDWDGTAPGGAFGNSGTLPAGTYYYIITVWDVTTGDTLDPINGYIYLGTK